MTRDEALAELEKPPYPPEQQKEDESYILKKLDIDPAPVAAHTGGAAHAG